MLERLRWQLTMWFVGLSMLLYIALSVAVIFVFQSGLNSVLEQELRGLVRELRPAIEYDDNVPTLADWADNIETRKIQLLATVQIFGPQGEVLEQYGPPGIPTLFNGKIESRQTGRLIVLESRYRGLTIDDNVVGYLQIQQSTKSRDDAMQQLFWTLALMAPFLVAGLGFCGYLFAGKALIPTEESFALLRRFVADAGHELNTPITVIQASVETLEKKLADLNVQSDIVNVIRRAGDRMASLGNDLMLLAKLESPQLVSPIRAVPFDEVVKDICDELAEAFRSKKISLNCPKLPAVIVMAQVDSMRTLVSNLVENSLRYTEEGGSVSITLEEKGGQIVFVVQDTGIGIPIGSLPRIFERFYRVDKSRSRLVGGSGLGLSIVKAIVDAHGGTIKVDSTVGKGTKIVVTLPIGNPPK